MLLNSNLMQIKIMTMERKDKTNFLYPKCLSALLRGSVEAFMGDGMGEVSVFIRQPGDDMLKLREKEDKKNAESVIKGNLVSLEATWG